jgi:predicted molibdopterin-dependent oxidoreductase YjgC
MEAFSSIILKTGALFLSGHTMLAQETVKETFSAFADLIQLIQPSRFLPVLGESNWMGIIKVVKALQRGTRKRTDILQEINNGTIQCLYVSGELAEDIDLSKCEFVVAQSVFKAPWMDKADVILPSSHMNENEGTVVNFEGRIQRIRRVSKPSGKSRPDGWIVSRIAKNMNTDGFQHRNTAELFEEMTSSVPGWKELTLGKLGKQGKHTGDLHPDKTGLDRRFFPFSFDAPKTESKKGYPFTLMVQWNLFHYRNGSLSALVPGMNEYLCENRIEVHPEDADRLGLQAGDSARIKTSEGRVLNGYVFVTDRIPKKTAAMWVSGVTLTSKLNFRTIHSVKIQKGDHD